MGVSRHDNILLLLRALNHYADKTAQGILSVLDFSQEPETRIGGDLVIAGTASVQFSTKRTDELAQSALVGGVDIFIVFLDDKLRARWRVRSDREWTRCIN